jgi:lysosomal-associated transmembrane protein
MRWKLNGEENQYRCFLCCHVRTGTIFLGLVVLMAHIMMLSWCAVVLLHPELIQQQEELLSGNIGQPIDSGALHGSTENNYSNVFGNYDWMKNKDLTGEDKFIGVLLMMGSFFVSVMLVYGAAKGMAGYLMPFFCLQVFYFCISCLSIVGYFSYMPDLKKWITMQTGLPFKDRLLAMDNDWLMLVAIIAFVLVLSFQAYFIGVVWACYKYLTSYNRPTAASIRTYENTGGEDGEMLLPPKYEDAIRMSEEQPPPPAYFPN